MSEVTPILQARSVTKTFTVRNRLGRSATLTAVQEVSIDIRSGSVVALVGESGSGKTTVARMLSLYYPPTTGEILLDGHPVRSVRGRSAKRYYGRVQLLFQDPFASLNSLKSVRHILGRALKIHGHAAGRKDVQDKVVELLERVNLHPGEEYIDKYPHELSGGQRQRIVIARALAVGAKVLLGDEPISMLDVSIRLDVLNLLKRLRDEEDLAILYITHDIASARYIADEIKVMYAGQMVESGPTEKLIQQPAHPYTQLLLNSSPDPDGLAQRDRDALFDDLADQGEPPSMLTPPTGCRFHPRCPLAADICRTQQPPPFDLGEGHWSQCWLLSPEPKVP